MVNNRDFSQKYNTPLSEEEMQQFKAWVIEESKRQGRNVDLDRYDYDIQGLWGGGDGFGGEGGHAGDMYKKPNHPTFSDESKYHGVDGYIGGRWSQDNNGMSYTPSKTNMYTPEELKRYFGKVEPGVALILKEILK